MLSRSDKTLRLQIGSAEETVSIDRLKPYLSKMTFIQHNLLGGVDLQEDFSLQFFRSQVLKGGSVVN